ncbi:F-box/kelch-repeat protein At3g06240-like [Primulina huaijiensis]|uniref:F-box/kelch-repeat protein At3g06240-like n=1 Tax=Primulina huaijiensis TaxID=1492673 RepID=UPI003CC79A5D
MNPTTPILINQPSEIIINILSRLPIRTILSCRCVCKRLFDLLSTPEFAESHLSLSTHGLLIGQLGRNHDDTCQIFEFVDEFELQHHNLHYNEVMKFDPRVSIGFSDGKLLISGSVNGILCLLGEESKLYDVLYLCNPITREHIALPRIEGTVEYPDISEYGFGVSRISGQYKVLRNVRRRSQDRQAAPDSTTQKYECLVYTVGTRSWRKIQPGKPFGHFHSSFSLFLNGNLHGFRNSENYSNMLISCFDLETESFKPFPPPPPPLDSPGFGTLGILDDCLCYIDNSSQDVDILVIWMMKEYGVKESWTKQLVIEAGGFVGLFYESIYPVKVFKDGDILFNYQNVELFYFSKKTKTCEELDFVNQDERGRIEAIPHNSSFLSLKSFDGENVELFS